MTAHKLTKAMRYNDAQIAALVAIDHGPDCKWYDDLGWHSATFSNYVHNTGDYPECTCAAGRAALKEEK